MPKTKPANLRRGISRVSGGVINDLNKIAEQRISPALIAEMNDLKPGLGDRLANELKLAIEPGLGTRLARSINQQAMVLNKRVEAQAGHHGTIVIAEQTAKDARGKTLPAMDLQGGSVVGLDNTPTEPSSPITLEYWRKHEKNCQWFEQMFEDCILLPEEMKKTGMITSGGDIIPWFFGYTIHPPNELDTGHGDLENDGRTDMWPFVLTHPSRINKITFGVLAHFFFITDPKVNVGLADTNLQLVCETGGVDISDPAGPAGQQKAGYYQTILETEVTVPAGEYYLLFSTNACIDMWSFNANATPIFPFLNKSKLRFIEAITATAYNNFPADFTAVSLDTLFDFNRVRIPIVLFEQ